MERILERIIGDAAIYGYDFEQLVSQIANDDSEIKEYVYGYLLSEDKLNYLEAMEKEEVKPCDRIYLFKDEINTYLKEISTVPHTRIISGFHLLEDSIKWNNLNYEASIFRIILIEDTSKKALIKDIEYVDNGLAEMLTVWGANLDYEEAVITISRYGEDELLSTASDMIDVFMIEGDIDLSETKEKEA